jgi:CMP-N-acetylneuraminic acid synthetase
MFEVDRSEAFDIDEELDFLLADLMISHQSKSDLV